LITSDLRSHLDALPEDALLAVGDAARAQLAKPKGRKKVNRSGM
jgi:hypothetical protein